MIYAIVTLGLSNLALATGWYFTAKLDYEARRTLTAAALEAKGLTDAARRAAAPTPPEVRQQLESQIKLQREIRENGGTFSSANPFGTMKPEGV